MNKEQQILILKTLPTNWFCCAAAMNKFDLAKHVVQFSDLLCGNTIVMLRMTEAEFEAFVEDGVLKETDKPS